VRNIVRSLSPVVRLGILLLLLTGTQSAAFAKNAQSGAAGDSSSWFSRLEKADTLRVSYFTSGCFHRQKAEITIFGSEPTLARIVRWSLFLVQNPKPDTTVVSLSDADRVGLDHLIAYYKSERPGGCTSFERGSLTLSHRGRKPRSESFFDASCEASGSGRLTFYELIHRPGLNAR
jgi:hypothetical protein